MIIFERSQWNQLALFHLKLWLTVIQPRSPSPTPSSFRPQVTASGVDPMPPVTSLRGGGEDLEMRKGVVDGEPGCREQVSSSPWRFISPLHLFPSVLFSSG